MPRPPAGPGLIMAAGLVLIVVFTFLYTSWAIDQHSRQACAELSVLATAPGAVTAYDKSIKAEYARLYALRCR